MKLLTKIKQSIFSQLSSDTNAEILLDYQNHNETFDNYLLVLHKYSDNNLYHTWQMICEKACENNSSNFL